jgi:hypothetical protein
VSLEPSLRISFVDRVYTNLSSPFFSFANSFLERHPRHLLEDPFFYRQRPRRLVPRPIHRWLGLPTLVPGTFSPNVKLRHVQTFRAAIYLRRAGVWRRRITQVGSIDDVRKGSPYADLEFRQHRYIDRKLGYGRLLRDASRATVSSPSVPAQSSSRLTFFVFHVAFSASHFTFTCSTGCCKYTSPSTLATMTETASIRRRTATRRRPLYLLILHTTVELPRPDSPTRTLLNVFLYLLRASFLPRVCRLAATVAEAGGPMISPAWISSTLPGILLALTPRRQWLFAWKGPGPYLKPVPLDRPRRRSRSGADDDVLICLSVRLHIQLPLFPSPTHAASPPLPFLASARVEGGFFFFLSILVLLYHHFFEISMSRAHVYQARKLL